MIREATREDIRTVNELVQAAARELNVEKDSGLLVDPPTIDAILRWHMRSNDAVVLVNEEEGVIDSAFIGALFPFYLDIRKQVAHEKISGGPKQEELWEAFKEWAKEQKAVALVRGCYDPGEGSRFRRLD